MPKRSLVLNGFLGGINKDSDATDVTSDGRGKDEVVTLKNMLADRGGKVYTSKYKFIDDAIINGTITSGETDLLIFGDIHYQQKGLYKIGGGVNWSNNLFKGPYVSQAHNPNSLESYIGTKPTADTDGTSAIFMGTGATNGGTNPIFGGVEKSTRFAVHDIVKSSFDGDINDEYFEGINKWTDGSGFPYRFRDTTTMVSRQVSNGAAAQTMIGEYWQQCFDSHQLYTLELAQLNSSAYSWIWLNPPAVHGTGNVQKGTINADGFAIDSGDYSLLTLSGADSSTNFSDKCFLTVAPGAIALGYDTNGKRRPKGVVYLKVDKLTTQTLTMDITGGTTFEVPGGGDSAIPRKGMYVEVTGGGAGIPANTYIKATGFSGTEGSNCTEFTVNNTCSNASGVSVTFHDSFDVEFSTSADITQLSYYRTTKAEVATLPITALGTTRVIANRIHCRGSADNKIHAVKIPNMNAASALTTTRYLHMHINNQLLSGAGDDRPLAAVSASSGSGVGIIKEFGVLCSPIQTWSLIKNIDNTAKTFDHIETWHGSANATGGIYGNMPKGTRTHTAYPYQDALPDSHANQGANSVEHDVTGAECLRLCRIADAAANSIIGFRCDAQDLTYINGTSGSVTLTNVAGLFDASTGLDIEDKDIYLEMAIDPTGVLAEDDFQSDAVIVVAFDSHKDNNEVHLKSNNDIYAVQYSFTYSDVVANGMWRDKARIKIPYDSYTRLGDNFDPRACRVASVMIPVIEPSGSYSWPTHPATAEVPYADLYELSVADAGKLGWSGQTIQISQTDTNNNSSSLPVNYSTVISFGSNNKLNLDIYRPNIINNGDIYYQTQDADEDSWISDKFLLANVDYAKGAKRVGEADWTPWTVTTVSNSTVDTNTTAGGGGDTFGDNPKVVQMNDTSIISVGMTISGNANIPNGSYVTEKISSTLFKISANVTGTANDVATNFKEHKVSFTYKNPPLQSTFTLETGYPEYTNEVNALWKTAATNGRQAYIGNIAQENIAKLTNVTFAHTAANKIKLPSSASWESSGYQVGDIIRFEGDSAAANNGDFKLSSIDASNPDIAVFTTKTGASLTLSADATNTTVIAKVDSDKILKAPPGKLYGFSDRQFIDLELGAGSINVLETAGDRLLVFSDDNLTIVNIAQDYEFLEASMPGYGVKKKSQVAKVSEGVAFVNSSGVFFFNGNTVDNISDNLLDTVAWSNTDSLTYDPASKMIMAWNGANDSTVYCYSLKTRTWVTMLEDVMDVDNKYPITNSVNYKGSMYVINDANNFVKFGTPAGARAVELETGRISCGDLAMEKSFKHIYISTVNNSSGTLNIKWKIDGGSWSSNTAIAGDGRHKISIKSKGRDIQFHISNTTAHTDFEISDLQLVYRDKRVK